MNRLPRQQKDDLIQRLSEWQSPSEILFVVKETMDMLGSNTLFNQSGLTFLRDAWIAGEFGQIRNAAQARLVPDEWPDFALLIDDQIESFEAVEADDPLRRRGDEYRDANGEVEDDPVEDWIARANQASTWLEAACRKKIDKRYGAGTNLVIYLNLNEFGIRQSQVEGCFAEATDAAKNEFESVWVLWKSRAYQVWP